MNIQEAIKFLKDFSEYDTELADSLKIVLAEYDRLQRFKEYWDGLYGAGLAIAGWHLNDATEPLDTFYDNAIEAYICEGD